MNDWLSIPAKTRIELLREYKRNGIGYNSAKKDFLSSYGDGGTVEKPVTTPTEPSIIDKVIAPIKTIKKVFLDKKYPPAQKD